MESITWIGKFPPDWEILVTSLRQRVTVANPVVLDVGAGNGQKTETLAFLGGSVLALDADPEKVAQGISRGIRMVQGDTQHLPFPDSSFDVVINSHNIEHVDDPSQAMREVFRVLRPEGQCFFITPNRRRWTALAARFLPVGNRDSKYPMNPDHVHEYTRQELTDLLRTVPFKRSQVEPILFNLPVVRFRGRPIGAKRPRGFLSAYSNQFFAWAQK